MSWLIYCYYQGIRYNSDAAGHDTPLSIDTPLSDRLSRDDPLGLELCNHDVSVCAQLSTALCPLSSDILHRPFSGLVSHWLSCPSIWIACECCRWWDSPIEWGWLSWWSHPVKVDSIEWISLGGFEPSVKGWSVGSCLRCRRLIFPPKESAHTLSLEAKTHEVKLLSVGGLCLC